MTDAQTSLQQIRDRVGKNEREGYGPAVAAGRIVEPRAGEPVREGGPRFKGCIALGGVSRRGDYFTREMRIVEDGRILSLCPRFLSGDEAHAFGLRLAMRVGPRLGTVSDDWAMLALESHLWLADSLWPRPSVTPDGVREALMDFLAGNPLDEGRLYGTEAPFEDVLTCPDGATWERVRTLSGAVSVTYEVLDATARDFDYEACLSPDGRPEAGFHVLRVATPEGRYIAAVVRVGPRGSAQDPQVNGPVNKDPFPRFGEHIALLGAHLGVAIGPEHYPHAGEPVGEFEELMAGMQGA